MADLSTWDCIETNIMLANDLFKSRTKKGTQTVSSHFEECLVEEHPA